MTRTTARGFPPDHATATVLAPWLVLLILALWGTVGSVGAAEFEDPFAPTGADSAAPEDPFGMEATDWDSVFAAVDRDFDRARGLLEPLVSLTYDKVAGLHADAGVAVGPFWQRRILTETRAGYDFGREKPTGSAGIRVGELDRGTAWVGLRVHSGISTFGRHQPYGNPLLAAVGGYDARGYLREEGGVLEIGWKPRRTASLEAAFLRTHQAGSPLTSDFHVFGSDRWMETLPAVQRWTGTGVRLEWARRPAYSEEVVLPGIYARARVETYGGALSSGPEFSHGLLEFRRIFLSRAEDELWLSGDFGITGGDAPPQFAQDLGGHGGLRGFEPRFDVGTQRVFLRSQFVWGNDTLGQIKLPLVGKTKLRLVPFAEFGAVWGDGSLTEADDLRLPRGPEVHWDLGVGLRRMVESSGLLSYLQVDGAWPMGADTGPIRVTLSLSSHGFE